MKSSKKKAGPPAKLLEQLKAQGKDVVPRDDLDSEEEEDNNVSHHAAADNNKNTSSYSQELALLAEEEEMDVRTTNFETIFRFTILGLICILAFCTRLFAVVRFESVIHEFDPYFNYRATIRLADEGFYEFLNWFDERTWYPIGRVVGGTVYPGLMVTAGFLHWLANALSLPINVRNTCVFLAPFFSANTALVTYALTSEAKDKRAGLLAAAFISIVPSYMSRSVAGSYDNEAVAIFAMVNTFYTFIKAVNTGSLFWAIISSLAYLYMVATWGGYVFVMNLIPCYTLVMIFIGRGSSRLYIAYSTFFTIGTLMSMQVPTVGFQAVQTGEHMPAIATFLFLQFYMFVCWVRSMIGSKKGFKRLIFVLISSLVAIGAGVLILALATGYIKNFTGRVMTLLDPTYATKYIPIIASVSEHQPTSWASYFFDLHVCVLLAPVGIFYCLKSLTDAKLFVVLYGMTTVYFAGVMVRMMLVLAPIACILGAIGGSAILHRRMRDIRGITQKKFPHAPSLNALPSLMIIAVIGYLLTLYAWHCAWCTSEAYSSPSIVLAGRGHDGSRIIFDDFREAYYWLRMNTADNAKVMSWWDYGYQMSAMANRTVLVDNNTWNNSHIATVGMAMSSPEADAYKVMQRLDVDYALVIFGGFIGYSSDDVNKFLWMVRIGGGVYRWIREPDYYDAQGNYRIDEGGGKALLNSLMYRMSYYNFDKVMLDPRHGSGFDRVRGTFVGVRNMKLEYIDEVYTTEHWLVRIYKVRKQANRWLLGQKLKPKRIHKKNPGKKKPKRWVRQGKKIKKKSASDKKTDKKADKKKKTENKKK